ncbi:MAG: pilus assembly PilX N-terminal domain-containing protein, partial [Dethiobacteria bacterium]
MRARRDDPERGSLLVMVAVYTAVLLMLGGALLTCAMTEQLIACNQEEEMRLYYIAEAGIEAGVAALACFFDYDRPISGSVGDGSYHVRIVPPPGLPESDPHYEMIPQLILPGQRLVISEGKLRGKTMA